MRNLLVVLGLVALLAACTGPPEERGGPDRLVVGTTNPVSTLDPAACYAYLCAYVILPNTHEGLVRASPGSPEPEPALATSWQVSEDGTEYTFTLRGGVRLHDGTPLTSDIVKASLERVRDTNIAGGPAFLLFDLENDEPTYGITAIETRGADTVVLTLAEPDSAFPARLAFPVGSVVSQVPSDDAAEPFTVAGTGPYRLDEVGDGVVELVRNDQYWGERAAEERVRIRVVPNPTDLAAAVGRGDVHLAVADWSRGDVQGLERRAGVEVARGPSAAIRFLAFNVEREPYDRAGLRRAVAASVDRQALVDGPLTATAVPLQSLIPDGVWGSAPAFEGLIRETIDGHLRGAGFGDETVELDLWYTPSRYGDAEEDVATAIVEMLHATGRFEITMRAADWAGYRAALARGTYGMYLLGWFPDFLDAQDYLTPFMSAAGARAVGSNYTADAVEDLLDELARAADAARRSEILGELQQELASDVPYVPLWQPYRHVATHGVGGLALDAGQELRLGSVSVRR